jgi:4-hydroxy-tetrahydrodipicolinate synthase
MHRLNGLITALVTPFNEMGELDIAGFRENIQFQLANQVDGLVVLGTTGEAPTLNEQEKISLIKIARAETKGKIPLVVGTGSYSTQNTIENTKKAKELGADAALVVNPYYNKPTQEGLYHHFRELTNQVSLPIIMYNHTGRCGIGMEITTMKKLAKIPNIIGLKEVTGSIEQVSNIMESLLSEFPNFKIFSGDDSAAFTIMVNGGHGVISVAGNLIPRLMKKLVDSCMDSDLVEARKLHFELYPMFRALNIETNPIPIKTAMNFCNLPAGPCRLPLCAMQPANKENLKNTIEGMKVFSSQLAGVHG